MKNDSGGGDSSEMGWQRSQRPARPNWLQNASTDSTWRRFYQFNHLDKDFGAPWKFYQPKNQPTHRSPGKEKQILAPLLDVMVWWPQVERIRCAVESQDSQIHSLHLKAIGGLKCVYKPICCFGQFSSIVFEYVLDDVFVEVYEVGLQKTTLLAS